jgi:proteasome lid subunit RPN8/RPN11
VIRLPEQPIEAIRRQVAAAFPNECCGILAGLSKNGTKAVHAVFPLPNSRIDSPHNRYFAPAEAIHQAEAKLHAQGYEVLGFYHSHPNAPAQPSGYDLDHATWPWFSYVIVSARGGRAQELTSWVLADDRLRFIQEPIEPAVNGHRPPEVKILDLSGAIIRPLAVEPATANLRADRVAGAEVTTSNPDLGGA